jgi:hypothetical protein
VRVISTNRARNRAGERACDRFGPSVVDNRWIRLRETIRAKGSGAFAS